MNRKCDITLGCDGVAIHRIDDSKSRPKYRAAHHGDWSCVRCILVGYEIGDRLPSNLCPEYVSVFQYLTQTEWDRYSLNLHGSCIENANEVLKYQQDIGKLQAALETERDVRNGLQDTIRHLKSQRITIKEVERIVPVSIARTLDLGIMRASRLFRLLEMIYTMNTTPMTSKALAFQYNMLFAPIESHVIWDLLNKSVERGFLTRKEESSITYELTEIGERVAVFIQDYWHLCDTLKVDTHECP